jgi:predicted small lipoprotein YifL
MMLICIMSVSACGKKPPHVDPPTDEDDTAPAFHYPAIYPDPATNK